jgi:hypothetical protein
MQGDTKNGAMGTKTTYMLGGQTKDTPKCGEEWREKQMKSEKK